ncbi:primosomal protein N' [Campylobacter sp. FMV-PI01]|uniref:Replication restart protein PriA n=1 Tax=Campylobacter portucalensis TaxID=2608384 RepID=A0A6L5WG68_9BACT|nr:primosomal protein N' [Campylobacter portucalensis]MSN96024.1 primosomal protein N' [Campylobacter portucalensis]
MFFYQVAILGQNLKPLTYFSKTKLEIYSLVLVTLSNKQKTAIILEETKKPEFETLEILEVFKKKFSNLQIKLAKFISYYYVCEIGIAFSIFTPFESLNFTPFKFNESPNLSPNQQKAKNFALNNKSSLIFGDTGSGKSEIYISLIIDTLNSNKQALFLMPEISLTPQMEIRLKKYFGDFVGVWHSKISPQKKEILLQKFEKGEIKLIAGARSALFLPFTNLGLIIVDEEHDDSYKSNQKPRYNARDLALYLLDDTKVVLGSATPCLSTFKKQPVFRLKGTFFESKKEIIYDENETFLSPLIISNLKQCLENSNQAILFLPTRANFKFMQCTNCKNIIKCPFCSVAMSLHKDKNALICHYCGHSFFYKSTCKICNSKVFEPRRMGTSEVVDELKSIFKDKVIDKFDKDKITTQKKLINLLKDFNDAKIDILVGTQMLSKGHDYHNVKLAVIMGIDSSLGYADFRAREKTLSLAMQLAGRVGRNGDGKVIIQTLQREFFNDFIQNYDDFLEEEEFLRKPLYPPFTRLLRILISHKNQKTAKILMQKCLDNLKNIQNIEIIGYGRANIEVIASKFRYEILMRSKNHKALINAAKTCDSLDGVEIDMDAINFS